MTTTDPGKADLLDLPIFGPAAIPDTRPTQPSPHPVPAGQQHLAPSPAAATTPRPETTTATGTDRQFWEDVTSFRGTVSERLTAVLSTRTLDLSEREALGQDLIQQVLQEHNDVLLSNGQRAMPAARTAKLSQALFDALFRLGRLQPLIDTPGVENIDIQGTKPALLLMSDGSHKYVDPVADTEDELIETLRFIAAQDPNNERAFTRTTPFLNLDLPGRVRLAAMGWVLPWTQVSIRMQTLKEATLPILRDNGTIDTVLMHFLDAAVKARHSVVVSGRGQGSGKTTMLRALCSALDPREAVATIETDYELYLHEEPDKHLRVVPFRTRQGTGERSTHGRQLGEIDANDGVYEVLRHDRSRVIVGEVRGREIVAMFKAMQMGNGSLSTVHADSAEEVVDRLVGMAVEESSLSENYAYRQIAMSIDYIVFLDAVHDPHTGRRTRVVSEVLEVFRGEAGNAVQIGRPFVPGPDGRAIPRDQPKAIDELKRAGFDESLLTHKAGLWEGRR